MSESLLRTDTPIRYGMLHPARISSDYDPMTDVTWLKFDGADGSQLRIGLSRAEVEVLAGLRSNDPQATARELYLKGHIDVDEFERRLEST